MTPEYEVLISLMDDAAKVAEKAESAARPWKTAAYRIAIRKTGADVQGAVRFEKGRFKVACRGTGIYSHEVWWEEFPIELLMEEMRETSNPS